MESGPWLTGLYDETLGPARRSLRELAQVQEKGDFILGLDACTDCYSLYSTLRNADLVRPQDDSLCVYIGALRQDMQVG